MTIRARVLLTSLLFGSLARLAFSFTNPNALVADDYRVALPAQRDREMPLLVVLPGKNVTKEDEESNWRFSATKNGFVLVTFDVNYGAIKEGSHINFLRDRIFKAVRDVQREKINVSTRRVYIAGTSMGGMMALSLALRYPKDFQGTSVVSGGLLRFGADQYLWAAKGRRFYFAQGERDSIVPLADFNQTKDALVAKGGIVTFDIYPGMGHEISGAYRKAVDSLAQ